MVILMCFDVAVSTLKLIRTGRLSPCFELTFGHSFLGRHSSWKFRECLPNRVVRFVVASRHTFFDGFVCGAAPTVSTKSIVNFSTL